MVLNPDLYLKIFFFFFCLVGFGGATFIMCFFPLAGFLADTKYGRYKTVVRSLFLVSLSIALMING